MYKLITILLLLLISQNFTSLLHKKGRRLQELSIEESSLENLDQEKQIILENEEEQIKRLKEEHEEKVRLIQEEVYQTFLEKLPEDSPLRQLTKEQLTEMYNQFLRQEIISQKNYHEYAKEAQQFFQVQQTNND